MSVIMRWMYKSGTCTSGKAKVGNVLHLVPDTEGTWTRAACGTKPKKKSNGWSRESPDELPVCATCLMYRNHHRVMEGLIVTQQNPAACRVTQVGG